MVLSGLHGAGIASLSWCVQDPGMLLASSKDGKIVCWNTKTVIEHANKIGRAHGRDSNAGHEAPMVR